MAKAYNKGEWSELYAFIKLLKEGRIYAADENANQLPDYYFPIIKMIREETAGERLDYYVGNPIRIFANGVLIREVGSDSLSTELDPMLNVIFLGSNDSKHGAFSIPGIDALMDSLLIKKVKASSAEKADLQMQVHDVHTGFSPEVGFSVKSDVGSAPTLLNAGKNTRIRYKVLGLSSEGIAAINSIDSSNSKNYMIERFSQLLSSCESIEFDQVKDTTFEDNLMMIDSYLPRIYGEMVLLHYKHLNESISSCNKLLDLLFSANPLSYHRADFYKHKFKKLLAASALGMTPGKPWDGLDKASGGYIIIKKDGDVVCYHLYNRNFFEEYLLNNTIFDRPSATRHDYGYVYECNGATYIDLNVQIRFRAMR